MKNKGFKAVLKEDIDRIPDVKNKPLFFAGFVSLLVLYLVAAIFTSRFSRSQDFLMIGNALLPVSSFTGVLSSLSNICIIFLVVLYKKPGFVIALAIMLIQFPVMTGHIIFQQNLASIPGFFGNLFTIIAILLIHSRNKQIEKYRKLEIDRLKEQKKLTQRMAEQTAEALVTAIDAKDEYSHGHSLRVAEYSRKIAQMMGKSEEECDQIYYAALLHDVGKIGIPDRIITKKSELTPGEYEAVKQHPVLGNQILSTIREYPYLSIGAHYHHERYDGQGYPDGLKGGEIPEIARIISVADAYDVMSSHRSYRDAVPQQLIREEIVKGAGTQFDPEMARIMQHLIDLDTEYKMKEMDAIRELSGNRELHCDEYRSDISDGIIVTPFLTKIHLKYSAEGKTPGVPSIILFDSMDGRIHTDETAIEALGCYEYCEIALDGRTTGSGVRKIRTEILPRDTEKQPERKNEREYGIEAVKRRDHVLIRIDDGTQTIGLTIALPDSTRFAYIGLTGEYCRISDISISKADQPVPDDYIPRIAEEISYIDGPEGDVPNVQADSYRTAATEGIPVTDGMKLSFHTRSLPTARLIWHCPYVDLFWSADRKVYGKDFREYALIRLDGESWDEDSVSENRLTVTREAGFEGWDAWKKANREGYDCTITFRREGNVITTMSENHGISVRNVTTVTDGTEKIYAALTGDQVALTNIRIG